MWYYICVSSSSLESLDWCGIEFAFMEHLLYCRYKSVYINDISGENEVTACSSKTGKNVAALSWVPMAFYPLEIKKNET